MGNGYLLCQRVGTDPQMEATFEAQGAKKITCNRCQHPVWISPKSIERIRTTGVEPVCNDCMPSIAKSMKGKDIVIQPTQPHHVKALNEVLNDLAEGHRRRN